MYVAPPSKNSCISSHLAGADDVICYGITPVTVCSHTNKPGGGPMEENQLGSFTIVHCGHIWYQIPFQIR